jgi:hypothetical protein
MLRLRQTQQGCRLMMRPLKIRPGGLGGKPVILTQL